MGKQAEYFDPLAKQMNNPECSLDFFHWLTKIPLETDGKAFHPGTQIPKTERKRKMMTMVLCNVDLWFLNLYQTLKVIFDGKSDHNMLECNQNTIIDKDGNFVVASYDLYSMYRLWYEKNSPEDRLASSHKFGLIMASILGQSVLVRAGNTVTMSYKSDIKMIKMKSRARHGCDPATIDTNFGL